MPLFEPDKLLRKYAPASKIKKLITNKLTVKKALLSVFDDMEFIPRKAITKTVLKAVKQYKAKYKSMPDKMLDAEAIAETLNDKKMLIQRVENTVIFNISQTIKENYEGEFYIWLPSSASEPDPIHALNYGKKFQIGVNEQPGDRWGCQCGMNILTKDENLNLT
jgi:hypothetical protein